MGVISNARCPVNRQLIRRHAIGHHLHAAERVMGVAMRIVSVGRGLFAATMIALGILGLIQGDFAPLWQPVPKWVPAREFLGYLCALISLASGAGLLWERTAAAAARWLLAYLVFVVLLFKMPAIFKAPAAAVSWESWGEGVVIMAGAWVLYAGFASDSDRRYLGFATGEQGVRIARALYALAMIAFGVAHLAYLEDTAALVPRWLPSHVMWVYFTGYAYIAAGAAMLLGLYARLAAVLSALQMGGFTFLVWAPVLAAGSKDPSAWQEGLISWTLTIGGWVVADSYRGMPWLAVGNRQRK
jgi:uncharacterized membrane protein